MRHAATLRGVDTDEIAEHVARMSQALLDFMEEKDVQQQQIARRLNRSNAYVWGRLTGRHNLSGDIVVAAALIAGMPPEQLWAELAVRAAQMSSPRPGGTAPLPASGSGDAEDEGHTQ